MGQDDGSRPSLWPDPEFEARRAVTRSHASEFLGLDEDDALALASRLGLVLRVLTPGNSFVTADMHPSRITVTVDEAGRVIESEAH
jgi:hypothetical protein